MRFLLAANPGSPPLPLAKVASGGELARAMLALRLVLTAAPPVLVFDEVDAGIGGQAALAVGRALAALGGDHQVLVVTHLPQVAAFADAQVSGDQGERGGSNRRPGAEPGRRGTSRGVVTACCQERRRAREPREHAERAARGGRPQARGR